jgi:Response regulator containing CheY-like receiver, AAA-type ATPase, and DNA-binding domains
VCAAHLATEEDADSRQFRALNSGTDGALHPGMPTVLLIEDDDGVRALLCRAFQSCGWTIVGAARATEARRLAASQPFDLIVADVVLPETNGVALAEQLRQMQPHASITFISGYPDRYLQQNIGCSATVPLLQKPFHFRTLLTRANRLTSSRPTTSLPAFDAAE